MPWEIFYVLKTACETQQCAAGSPHDEGKSAPASPVHQPAVSGSHMTPDLNHVLPFCPQCQCGVGAHQHHGEGP